MKKYFHDYFIIFGLVLISIPLILPYLRPEYFPTHDGEWAVVRAVEMFREIRDIQIPPRFSGSLNFGYGYPLFNFAYPFPYYLSLVLHMIGFSFISSIKLLFALSVPLSAIFMYLVSRKIWSNKIAGIVSAVIYIYVPYRMVDLYVRGSLGESISFVLYPLIVYLLVIFIQNKNLLTGIASGLLFSILVLTHNIMAVYFLLITGLFFFANIITGNKKLIKPLLLFGLIGFAASSYFWLPALVEKQYILLSQVPIADRNLYYPSLKELFLPSWGYGGPTSVDGFSYQFGISITLLFIIFAATYIFRLIRKEILDKKFTFILLTLSVISFLLFPISSVIWENSPLLSEINYPWTLLGPISFLASLGAGFLTKDKITKYAAVTISIISIITVLPYARPEKFVQRTDDFYIANDATTTSSNELMPLWVKKHPIQMAEKRVDFVEDAQISDEQFQSNKFSFQVDSSVSQDIAINRIYYPGWEVFVNNNKTSIGHTNEKGIMEISVPQGKSEVTGKLSETPLRQAANLLSLLTLLFTVIILIKTKDFEKRIFK